MNFLETPVQGVQRSLNLLFQRTLFLMFPLFQKNLNSKFRTNKLVKSVVYHPYLSRLASRIHPFIFLETPSGFVSLKNVCLIFSNLFFQFMVFIFPENALNLCIFTYAPVLHSKLPVKFFENLFPLRRKRWRKLWNEQH